MGLSMRRFSRIFGRLVLLCAIIVIGYETVSVVVARHATPDIFQRILAEDKGVVLSDIPAKRVDQLLAVEDPGFYQHNGVDLSTPGAGLTTITQAMVKYLYFDDFRSGFMKLEQTLIARLAVDPLISKDEQLTVFINTAYLGHVDGSEVRGFPSAAKVYFRKAFYELTDEEYLSLVAMLIAPNRFSVKYHPDKNRERVELIKMVLSGEYRPKGNRDVYYGQSN
jgi:membrane peptidoglycan carboxypeptidase